MADQKGGLLDQRAPRFAAGRCCHRRNRRTSGFRPPCRHRRWPGTDRYTSFDFAHRGRELDVPGQVHVYRGPSPGPTYAPIASAIGLPEESFQAPIVCRALSPSSMTIGRFRFPSADRDRSPLNLFVMDRAISCESGWFSLSHIAPTSDELYGLAFTASSSLANRGNVTRCPALRIGVRAEIEERLHAGLGGSFETRHIALAL